MTRQEAYRRAPLTFTKRFGSSTMPLDVQMGVDVMHGDVVHVRDPEDGMRVSYSFSRRCLVQVGGRRERC